jgi:hypothetical protein
MMQTHFLSIKLNAQPVDRISSSLRSISARLAQGQEKERESITDRAAFVMGIRRNFHFPWKRGGSPPQLLMSARASQRASVCV